MNKRLILLFTILLVAVLGLSLTACSGESVNYDGKVALTFTFDEVYKDAEISCPTAKITKIDDKTFKCELDTLVPVKIFASAEGKETQIFEYSRDDLAKGDATINVTFKNQKYRVSFDLSLENAPTVIGNDDVKVEKIGANRFELVSSDKISEDIKLDLGEEYYPLVISGKSISYSLGTYGRIKDSFEILKKADNMAIFYAFNQHTDIISVEGGASKRIDREGTKVKITDYYVKSNSGDHVLYKITKEELMANPYQYIREYSIRYKSSRSLNSLRNINADLMFSNNGYGEYSFTSDHPIKAGTIFIYGLEPEHGAFHRNKQYIYKITKEDIANGMINLTPENSKELRCDEYDKIDYSEYFGNHDFKIHIRDRQGKKVDGAKIRISNNNQEFYALDNDVVNLHLSDKIDAYVYTEVYGVENYKMYTNIDTSQMLATAMMNETGEPSDLYLNIDKTYHKTIRYYDEENDIPLLEIDNVDAINYHNVDIELNDRNYRIVDPKLNNSNGFIFDKDLYTADEIVFNVEKVYNAIIKIDNYDKFLSYGRGRMEFSRNNRDMITLGDRNDGNGDDPSAPRDPSIVNRPYVKSDLGKKLTYTVQEYVAMNLGYTTIRLVITLPDEKNWPEDNIVHAVIEDVRDEWNISGNDGGYKK